MEKTNPNNLSPQEAMRLAYTPAGQELIRLLQQKGGNDLQKAMAKAVAGDFSQAKQALASIMDSPEVKKLLEQMGSQT